MYIHGTYIYKLIAWMLDRYTWFTVSHLWSREGYKSRIVALRNNRSRRPYTAVILSTCACLLLFNAVAMRHLSERRMFERGRQDLDADCRHSLSICICNAVFALSPGSQSSNQHHMLFYSAGCYNIPPGRVVPVAVTSIEHSRAAQCSRDIPRYTEV